jgi:hypothetical protein
MTFATHLKPRGIVFLWAVLALFAVRLVQVQVMEPYGSKPGAWKSQTKSTLKHYRDLLRRYN